MAHALHRRSRRWDRRRSTTVAGVGRILVFVAPKLHGARRCAAACARSPFNINVAPQGPSQQQHQRQRRQERRPSAAPAPAAPQPGLARVVRSHRPKLHGARRYAAARARSVTTSSSPPIQEHCCPLGCPASLAGGLSQPPLHAHRHTSNQHCCSAALTSRASVSHLTASSASATATLNCTGDFASDQQPQQQHWHRHRITAVPRQRQHPQHCSHRWIGWSRTSPPSIKVCAGTPQRTPARPTPLIDVAG